MDKSHQYANFLLSAKIHVGRGLCPSDHTTSDYSYLALRFSRETRWAEKIKEPLLDELRDIP